jgi:hypothetical protein
MFDLLRIAKYGEGKYIDIAKGKYKLATTLREGLKQLKRLRYDKKSN